MIIRIDSSYPILPLVEFCTKSIGDSRPNSINMDPRNWEDKSHTFLYLLKKEKRFDGPKAGYLIYIKNNEIVAGMGWYPSDWDENMYVQCRAYTIPRYLKNVSVSNAPLTNDLTWCMEDTVIKQGYKGGCVSVEKYNKKIIDTAIRINNPSRYPEYRKINNIEYRKPGVRMRQQKYAGLCVIKNTEQHLMYHLFDDTYEEEFLEKIKNVKANGS